MLLVDDDDPEVGEGREHRRTDADRDPGSPRRMRVHWSSRSPPESALCSTAIRSQSGRGTGARSG